MGMITFSQKAKLALALNQTDTCNVLITLSKDMLANRANRIKADLDGVAGKETNLINAALVSVDAVRASNIQQVIIGKIQKIRNYVFKFLKNAFIYNDVFTQCL